MKIKFNIIKLILFVLILIGNSSYAQKAWKLDLDGGVKDEDTKLPLEGAKVELYKNGAIIKSVYANSKGKFSFLLEADQNYIVKVSYKGFISKLITISSENVPEKANITENFFVKMQVSLFKEVPDIDFSVLEKPIGSIFYDKSEEKFGYDVDYELSKRLEQLQKDYDKKMKENAAAAKKAADEALKKELADKEAAERAALEAKKNAEKNAVLSEKEAKKKAEKEEEEKLAKKKAELEAIEAEKEAKRRAEKEEEEKKLQGRKSQEDADKEAKRKAKEQEEAEKEAKRLALKEEAEKKLQGRKSQEEAEKQARELAAKEAREKAEERRKKIEEEAKDKVLKAREAAELRKKEAAERKKNLVESFASKPQTEKIPVENIRTSQSEGVNYHIDHTFITLMGEEIEYKKIVFTWGGVYFKRAGLDISTGTYIQEMRMFGVEVNR